MTFRDTFRQKHGGGQRADVSVRRFGLTHKDRALPPQDECVSLGTRVTTEEDSENAHLKESLGSRQKLT